MIVYVSIGNSDDKLTQRRWAEFVTCVQQALDGAVAREQATVHGSWRSPSDAPWQNACWCVEFGTESIAVEPLRELLAELAGIYRQDSIAWAEVKETQFLAREPKVAEGSL